MMVYQTAEMCVYISDSFLCCVGLVGPTCGMWIVEHRQYIQEFVFLIGLDSIQVLWHHPVVIKEVQNIGNLKPWDCWLSCWAKLCGNDKKRVELIGQ